MDTKLIARLIDLVRKTGDRVVIPDDMENGRAVVIMDLDAYEELMGTAAKEIRNEGQVSELPFLQMFEPEPVMPEKDVVQQIRAIRTETVERGSPPSPPATEGRSGEVGIPNHSPRSDSGQERVSRDIVTAPPANLPTAKPQDLTRGNDGAKIKPEIGDWKTIGQVRPSAPPTTAADHGQRAAAANQPVVQPASAAANQLEDEERFYLEPIE